MSMQRHTTRSIELSRSVVATHPLISRDYKEPMEALNPFVILGFRVSGLGFRVLGF